VQANFVTDDTEKLSPAPVKLSRQQVEIATRLPLHRPAGLDLAARKLGMR
jgi:hypothetical protein